MLARPVSTEQRDKTCHSSLYRMSRLNSRVPTPFKEREPGGGGGEGAKPIQPLPLLEEHPPPHPLAPTRIRPRSVCPDGPHDPYPCRPPPGLRFRARRRVSRRAGRAPKWEGSGPRRAGPTDEAHPKARPLRRRAARLDPPKMTALPPPPATTGARSEPAPRRGGPV